MRFEFQLIFIMVGALSSCVKLADNCVERHHDTSWESIDGRDAHAEVARYIEMPHGVQSAEAVFGPHRKKESSLRGVKFSWLRGARRSAKTFSCDGGVIEIWQVSYVTIEIVEGDPGSCTVTMKNFIGKNGSPNPDVDTPIQSSLTNCKDFLME